MNIEITGRNYEVNDRIRKMIETKLSKVTKYFTDIIEVRCVLHVEKYRNICDIIIHGRLHDTISKQEAGTMEDAVNSAIDHIKAQAQKNRKKITQRRRGNGRGAQQALDNWTVQIMEPGLLRNETDSRPRVIRTSNLPIRPMSRFERESDVRFRAQLKSAKGRDASIWERPLSPQRRRRLSAT